MHNTAVEKEFERALEAILARVFVLGNAHLSVSPALPESMEHLRMGVAYSGGLDSTVLLHLAHRFALSSGCRLFAFHVHHGLNAQADDWLAHCRNECQRLDIPFDSRRVQLDRKSGDGIEAEAREKRYRALGEMCREHDIPLLLTAHHEDDQVETVLLQLMRGAGVAGLSGMETSSHSPELLGDEKLILGRPLLSVSRKELASWLVEAGVSHIDDDSNDDVIYTRNAIRHRLVPVLEDLFPGFQKRLSRTAQHAGSAQRLLEEMARKDIESCEIGKNSLNLERMRPLKQDRIDNLLRYWLAVNGVRMPSAAWLWQARDQLMNAREDAQIDLVLDGYTIRRYRQTVSLAKTVESAGKQPHPFEIQWHGERTFRLHQWHGTLYFEESETGFDIDWLQRRKLRIEPYRGNARLKLAGRPTKTLKALCQEKGIPSWERQFLPLVFFEDNLVYVGGIGISGACLKKNGNCVQIRWERDT